MTTISEIMGCASPTNKRPPNDRYDTPAWCTEALVRGEAERIALAEAIWEPAAGGRAMSKVLVEYARVIETDLVPFRGVRELDFLTTTRALAPAIVTNPPYKHASAFIEHAVELGVSYHAWLLKADFLCARERLALVNDFGYPARIWGLIARPDFRSQGAPTMNCAWFVWDGVNKTHSRFELLAS
jgi:hypothetical protein